MKKIYLIYATSTILFLAACEKEDAFYYDVRDAYVGHYTVDDYCDIGVADYQLDVYKSNDYDDIVFGFPGLFEAGMDVSGIVTGMKVIIPIQQFYISSWPEIFYEFSGSGFLEDSIFTIDYQVLTIQNGLVIDDVDCHAVMSKE